MSGGLTRIVLQGIMSLPALAMPIIGPVIGGVLSAWFPWRASFIAVAAIAMVPLLTTLLLLPDTLDRETARHRSLNPLGPLSYLLIPAIGILCLQNSVSFGFMNLVLTVFPIGTCGVQRVAFGLHCASLDGCCACRTRFVVWSTSQVDWSVDGTVWHWNAGGFVHRWKGCRLWKPTQRQRWSVDSISQWHNSDCRFVAVVRRCMYTHALLQLHPGSVY
jgi:MFS family permease